MPLDAQSERVLELAKKNDVKFINLQFTDIWGNIKSTAITAERLDDSLEKGTWYDGSSIEGFLRIAESDMVLRPDPKTFKILPWRPKEKAVARMICDVYRPDGEPFEGDPRYILKRQVAELAKMGYGYNCGPELEFFLLNRSPEGKVLLTPHDSAGYFDFAPRDEAFDVRRDIVLGIEAMGMEVEMSHHEVAPGQQEIDIRYGDALSMADNAVTLRYTVKTVARQHGLHATFMPKPIFGINGSGMHTHQSFFNLKDGKNVFYDANDKYKLSQLAYKLIAGQLKHVRGFSCVTAPNVNSYKRLVPGYEAPVYIAWARRNRSALIRVPSFSPGREQATRCELRCPDPSCNPYLAFAVMLGAGIDGINNNLLPPEPVEEDVYHFDDEKLRRLNIGTLPGSLGEALAEMEKSELVQKVLGPHTFQRYIEGKREEWDEYRIQVSEWEHERYLEVF